MGSGSGGFWGGGFSCGNEEKKKEGVGRMGGGVGTGKGRQVNAQGSASFVETTLQQSTLYFSDFSSRPWQNLPPTWVIHMATRRPAHNTPIHMDFLPCFFGKPYKKSMWIGGLWAGLRVAMWITHVGGKFCHGLLEKSLIIFSSTEDHGDLRLRFWCSQFGARC